MITKQEIFDRVARHLLTQMKKSQDNGGTCLYRGPDGTKCALGILIDDDAYDPRLETKGPFDAMVIRALCLSLSLPEIPGLFFEELQSIHDRRDPVDWKDCLQVFAASNGLEWHQ